MTDDPRSNDPAPCCCGGGAAKAEVGAAQEAAIAENPVTEEQVLALVDHVLGHADQRARLIPLLEENHPVYEGRSAGFVADLRGWILAAFEQVGLPEEGLIFVLEELQTGVEAYLVGAAARALRGYAQPRADFVAFLETADTNIRKRDDALSFEHFGAKVRTLGTGTTALIEIATTFGWMGRHAQSALPTLRERQITASRELTERLQASIDEIEKDSETTGAESGCCSKRAPEPEPVSSCCSSSKSATHTPAKSARHVDLEEILDLDLQDQDGQNLRFRDFFTGRPSVVTFFYTRCDNPFKCPVTMANLASFQELLHQEGLGDRIRTAGITYDPSFDLPIELKGYGAAYNVRMGQHHRLLRTPKGLDSLQSYFNLGVNFVDSIVNRHRIEAYILDEHGRVVEALTHLRWEENDLLDRVRALLPG
ncbi:MAG: SCO family protein, partial [Planctomycetota bacterium]